MEKEKISIIIPVYNVEMYLDQCLQSVINQTYSNLEIIIIDDGSTDQSGTICDDYAERDDRIVLIHQQNAGLSSARNVGIVNVTGDYVMYVDSDDWLDTDMIEKMYQVSDREDADIVVSSFIYQNVEKNHFVIVQDEKTYNAADAIRAICTDKKLKNFAWGKLLRRKLIEGIRFPDGKKFEDICTMYRYFQRANKVVQIQNCFYHYRVRTSGISRTKTVDNAIERIDSHILRYDNLKDDAELVPILISQMLYAVVILARIEKKSENDQKVEKNISDCINRIVDIIQECQNLSKLTICEQGECHILVKKKKDALSVLPVFNAMKKIEQRFKKNY